MARILEGITGNRTLQEMLQTLRPEDRAEALARPSLVEVVSEAKWAWTLEDDQGQFVGSMAIVHDFGRRGYFCCYPTEGMTASQLRPLFRMFTTFRDSGVVYDELRAWVASEDRRAKRFAEWFGFVYDCGPAAGLSPTGRDQDLYLWRR